MFCLRFNRRTIADWSISVQGCYKLCSRATDELARQNYILIHKNYCNCTYGILLLHWNHFCCFAKKKKKKKIAREKKFCISFSTLRTFLMRNGICLAKRNWICRLKFNKILLPILATIVRCVNMKCVCDRGLK